MDDPYRAAIEERIRELQMFRRWITSHAMDYRWNDLRDHYRVEAGALNRVRNKARKTQHVDARGDHFVGVGR